MLVQIPPLAAPAYHTPVIPGNAHSAAAPPISLPPLGLNITGANHLGPHQLINPNAPQAPGSLPIPGFLPGMQPLAPVPYPGSLFPPIQPKPVNHPVMAPIPVTGDHLPFAMTSQFPIKTETDDLASKFGLMGITSPPPFLGFPSQLDSPQEIQNRLAILANAFAPGTKPYDTTATALRNLIPFQGRLYIEEWKLSIRTHTCNLPSSVARANDPSS
jgi:hypothetical protein